MDGGTERPQNLEETGDMEETRRGRGGKDLRKDSGSRNHGRKDLRKDRGSRNHGRKEGRKKGITGGMNEGSC